jgi:hypothetical protein
LVAGFGHRHHRHAGFRRVRALQLPRRRAAAVAAPRALRVLQLFHVQRRTALRGVLRHLSPKEARA